MRILHIPHAYMPVIGGTEQLCRRISETMVDMGHDVTVLTSNVSDVNAYYQLGFSEIPSIQTNINGVNIIRFNYCGSIYKMAGKLSQQLNRPIRQHFASAILSNLQKQFTSFIVKQIRSQKPDLVMTLPHLVTNVRCAIEAHHRINFPLVVTPLIHPGWTEATISQITTMLKKADAVIAVTDPEAEQLKSTYGVSSERLFNVSMGVDIPRETSVARRTSDVLFLGRKVISKGVVELVEAMRYVWRERPDANLILAGPRTTETPALDRAIVSLSEAEQRQIRDLDHVSETEKSALLASACCLVLPSQQEAFGIVLLEAMAHSTPVIALDLAIFRHIVDPGVDGFLVPPAEPATLARNILFVLNNPDIASQMGAKGRCKVAQDFRWPDVTARYLEAYSFAISSCKR